MSARFASALLAGAAIVLCAAHAYGSTPLDRMMQQLAPRSAASAETIRTAYQEHLDFLTLNEYAEIEGALDNGGLVPLPEDSTRFNLLPRLDGQHPIGEMDLKNQSSYAAARAATIGALIEIASQVKSGPVEITSLVRHSDYQEVLRTSNANATTSVPMHTMGLAADIGLVNSRLETVYENRHVLRRMQDAGDILFIGERRQLVFHVVPHPSRLGHFNEVYLRAVGTPPTSRFAEAIAFLPDTNLPADRSRRAVSVAGGPSAAPSVTTEILAIVPTEGPVQNLWVDESDPMTSAPAVPTMRSRTSMAFFLLQRYWSAAAGDRWAAVLVACAAAWLLASRPAAFASLFEPT